MAFPVPAVTQEDLNDFRAVHFNYKEQSQWNTNISVAEQVNGEIHDDLSYYPDGVKRTLTDEQIAMFRHSEVQALLREQRRRAESNDDGNDHEESPEKNQSTGVSLFAGKQDHYEHGPCRKKLRTASKTNETVKQWRMAELHIRQSHVVKEDPRGRTHRRIARELDEVKLDDMHVELDY